jgi:molybdenum cofactor cytidylyltransferase
MADRPPKIGAILLAAGRSSRFGSPKQLAQYEGKSLIRRAAESLTSSLCNPVIVVLGAEIERCRFEVADLPVIVCINDDWRSGMSSSIRSGLSNLLAIKPDVSAVIIALCDQPYITSENINLLATRFIGSSTNVVAAGYNGVQGVPALFASLIFDQLLSLEGDKGARHLIRSLEHVETVQMEESAFDVDTPGDL